MILQRIADKVTAAKVRVMELIPFDPAVEEKQFVLVLFLCQQLL